jgi:hypothetical protein
VDDIFCVVRKHSKNNLLDKLNKFNKDLKLTMDSMIDNKLVFLDTQVVNTNGNLHLDMYRK